jgi:hypothetical protein
MHPFLLIAGDGALYYWYTHRATATVIVPPMPLPGVTPRAQPMPIAPIPADPTVVIPTPVVPMQDNQPQGPGTPTLATTNDSPLLQGTLTSTGDAPDASQAVTGS